MKTTIPSQSAPQVPQSRIAPHLPGLPALIALILLSLLSFAGMIFSFIHLDGGAFAFGGVLLVLSLLGLIVFPICFAGLKVLAPNQAYVFTLFGRYYGTLCAPGFYFVHPFAAANAPAVMNGEPTGPVKKKASFAGIEGTVTESKPKKISMKTRTLDNRTQKVNDAMGNPIIIGTVVIWRVSDPTEAVFAVENFEEYLSIQCDSTIRSIASLYPYDDIDETSAGMTLRGSSSEVSDIMQETLAKRVKRAGIVIEDVRITTLAYSDEIAGAMLQRQQATAVIAARQKIVEGAVGMVKMAIDQLGEEEIVVLDEERKAAMVSNLLVVLCGSKEAQPIVNSGSIY
ncbi:MAG: SPFH domain-containing protein [Clostridia bacterium]|nr:SPFH domain-containing protein [Clostridia bacterium]MBQ4609414.1 SPFH domain-containing protein [Clostridia bacterium]MBQ6859680.1 SPFH domain-containing protein [Clostridia bacterium]MBQ7051923.1 SPFH domain-containing protein [Clostridia bacterium]